MTGLIDSHCHIGHIDAAPEEVVVSARAAGVKTVVDIGMGLEESRVSAERARTLAPHVLASVGIHPNDLAEFTRDPDAAMAFLHSLATLPRVVAIGETGIDRYRDRSSIELQDTAFRAHIELAKQTRRTLVIHCRDAHRDVLETLADTGPPDRVVMHCFSGDAAFAKTCGELGYFCSFAGNLTYKKSDDLRAAAAVVPARLLLMETDAPFLAPHPHRGKPNSPALLPHTANVLAQVRSMSVDALTQQLERNFSEAFAL